MTVSDEEIMIKVKNGNLGEMSELFERYHVRLYNFFLKMTFDQFTSEDLTQNLFYRMLKYRHSFSEHYTFKSWIYQMGRNPHADFYKQQKKVHDKFKTPEFVHENVSAAEDDGFVEEDFERLEKALAKLEPEQRELIILSRYQGLKYEEISKIHSISVPAIKVQIHRAIKKLKDFYFQQN